MSFDNLDERIKNMVEKGRAKRVEAAQPDQGQLAQLPLWPELTRGTPNSFLRGALFAAIQGKERQYLKGTILASQKGQTIRFTGMQLDQSDLDVWEQAAHLAKSDPLGNVCHFHINAFLRTLGRDTGKTQHEWLKDSFRRLMSAGVEITHGRYTYGGSMLEFTRDDIEEVYVIRLNPKILSLYNAGWTAIDWEVRQALRRKPLALWLHGYFCSHAENYPTKLETIQQLSGSRNKQKSGFKRHLLNALQDLEGVGAIQGYAIEGDLVTITRTPSPTQIRHITQKATKPRKK